MVIAAIGQCIVFAASCYCSLSSGCTASGAADAAGGHSSLACGTVRCRHGLSDDIKGVDFALLPRGVISQLLLHINQVRSYQDTRGAGYGGEVKAFWGKI